jgi:hypothetical protein
MSDKKKKHTLTVNLTETTISSIKEKLLREGISFSEYVQLCFCLPFIKPELFRELIKLLSDEKIEKQVGSYEAADNRPIKTTARKLYRLLSKSFPLKSAKEEKKE